MRVRGCHVYLLVCALVVSVPVITLRAQGRHVRRAVPSVKSEQPHMPQIKPDMLTLRYKPQAGTLLYGVHTQITQDVNAGEEDEHGILYCDAELAFHNEAIDYKKGLWSFDEYFTNFAISGKSLSGDSLSLFENLAVNRLTRVTYNMKGNELARYVRDSLVLLNAEAQTNAYFFEPPRMLIPLPEQAITYGDTWQSHSCDTIPVHDTINVGTTAGAYIYDVSRTYRFIKLLDTMNSYLAIIVARDTGTFHGFQSNSATNVTTHSSGPLSGTDTTILDLFSGSVLKRTLDMVIPTRVTIESEAPFSDILKVRSVVRLSEANAKLIGD